MPIHDAITQQIFVPDRLYHGTTDVRLAAIMIDGLRPNYPDKESMLSDYGVYRIVNGLPTFAYAIL